MTKPKMALNKPPSAQAFKFEKFSKKQMQMLTWWLPDSPHNTKDMIIADGSIRSGKTVSMILSFLLWSISSFHNKQSNFIVAGKSMGALKRNVMEPMFQILTAKGINYKYIRNENPHVKVGNNTYYLFGAANDASQDYLQG